MCQLQSASKGNNNDNGGGGGDTEQPSSLSIPRDTTITTVNNGGDDTSNDNEVITAADDDDDGDADNVEKVGFGEFLFMEMLSSIDYADITLDVLFAIKLMTANSTAVYGVWLLLCTMWALCTLCLNKRLKQNTPMNMKQRIFLSLFTEVAVFVIEDCTTVMVILQSSSDNNSVQFYDEKVNQTQNVATVVASLVSGIMIVVFLLRQSWIMYERDDFVDDVWFGSFVIIFLITVCFFGYLSLRIIIFLLMSGDIDEEVEAPAAITTSFALRFIAWILYGFSLFLSLGFTYSFCSPTPVW